MSRLDLLDAREARALVRLQGLAQQPPVTRAAHVLSSAGEHAWLWLLLSGAGLTVDRARRAGWAEVGAAALLAHAAAVVLKRVVRRRRPHASGLVVLDATPSDLSFPSAHAASTTAAAVAATPLVGALLTTPVAVAMYLARMLLGVHYPSDVSAGALLGVVSVRLVRRVAGAVTR
jgi:membrane-associated phospholipid phosphatase